MSVSLAIGIDDSTLIRGPTSAIKPRVDPGVDIEPGELNPDDLAKRIEYYNQSYLNRSKCLYKLQNRYR